MKLKPNTRYLIVHADDGGMCNSVNQAIISALKSGIVTSTSLMVPCPHFEDIAKFFKQNAQYDVGIHLTLTCEYLHYPWAPVSDKERVNSLVNSKGFLKTKKEFVAQATPESVEIELRAQIERFLEFGIKPTHLDTHQGTVFYNLSFLEIYVKLGLEYNIPPMLIKPNEYNLNIINNSNLKIDEKVIENLMALGIPFLDFLYMADDDSKNLEEMENKYANVLEKIPAGFSQIIIHPGFNDEELKKITSHSINRFYDFSVFTKSSTKQLIDEQNIILIGWSELADEMNLPGE